MASSSATVAPLLAALVAPILQTPWALFLTPAFRQASENALPKDYLVNGPPPAWQMKARSPHRAEDAVAQMLALRSVPPGAKDLDVSEKSAAAAVITTEP